MTAIGFLTFLWCGKQTRSTWHIFIAAMKDPFESTPAKDSEVKKSLRAAGIDMMEAGIGIGIGKQRRERWNDEFANSE